MVAYMVLGTADADGAPWVSPVWYARQGENGFLWVSEPGTRHSRNIAVRPRVSLVIFDSTVAPGHATALYAEATAQELAPGDPAIEVFAAECVRQGLRPWTAADVAPDAEDRLYRATATAFWTLGERSRRVPLS